jgi:c-di-GMP-binding flagellar brake protein YcgR
MKSGTGGGEERRFTARFKVDLRVKAFVRGARLERVVHGQASDLSLGGLSLFLPTDLALGEVVEMELTIPFTASPVRILTVVRNRRSYQYGVEFSNLSADTAAAIRRACVSLALV